MSFLIIVLGIVVAKEVAELEPMQALYSDYPCSYWTQALDPNGVNCRSKPYCYYAANQCIFDPCLTNASADWTDTDCSVANSGNGDCKIQDAAVEYADANTCANPNTPVPQTAKVCRFKGGENSGVLVDSCTYEYLSSNKTSCDKWLCTPGAKDVSDKAYCGTRTVPDPYGNTATCSDFTTSDWCKLSPYCYWSSDSCVQDYCTRNTVNCDIHKNSVDDLTGTVCSSFSMFNGTAASGSSETQILCVDSSKNPTPNKCYYLGVEDHQPAGSGLCRTYTLPKCSANEECIAQFPTSGPFGGTYYCGDAGHTAGASVLRIPLLLLLLLVALFAF